MRIDLQQGCAHLPVEPVKKGYGRILFFTCQRAKPKLLFHLQAIIIRKKNPAKKSSGHGGGASGRYCLKGLPIKLFLIRYSGVRRL
jgi:hypothetical protein